MTVEPLAAFQARFAKSLLRHDATRCGPGYAVHARNVSNSLVAALAQTFPVVAGLIGEARFDQAAFRFASEEPPRLGWMSAYGEAFPEFLARCDVAASFPCLPDLARLEWARVKATFADDAPILDLHGLAQLSGPALEEVHVTLHPAASLILSRYPIYLIWSSHHQAPPSAGISFADVSDSVLVTRSTDSRAAVIRLPRPAAAFVTSLSNGQSLGEAWQTALDEDPEFDLSSTLRQLVEERALAPSAP